jgi:hypothetical protein
MMSQWFDNPASVRFKLRRHLHQLSGGWIDHPRMISSLRYYRERDAEFNSKSTPSENEHVEVLALWALEMYTPSNVGNLEQGLRKLGWGNDDFDWPKDDPITWVQSSRQGQGGGWMNLGMIRRPGEFGKVVGKGAFARTIA